ncbi:P-loop containing nucleoside triphosphate hydrolase protein [Annulohypoxylon bovei var. microspora]|nr:P-loop containing nucleoside triphosphate hydrolase protein [Annulohypoxylon bovei var. microspora]
MNLTELPGPLPGPLRGQQDSPMSESISGWLKKQPPLSNRPVYVSPTDNGLETSSSEQNTLMRREESRRAQEDIIAVIGRTGCGKSSFISKLAVKDDTGTIRHDPTSETHSIREVECRVQGRKVVFLDTAGFGDTASEGETVLERIMSWLHRSYGNKKFLTGLIYMHDIQDTQIWHSSVKSVKLLRKITGQERMNSVILLTTKWDSFDNYDQLGKEANIRKYFSWRGMTSGGATVMKHDGSVNSAERVVLSLLNKRPPAPNLREQMVEDRKVLLKEELRGIMAITVALTIIQIAAIARAMVMATTAAIAMALLATMVAAAMQIIAFVALIAGNAASAGSSDIVAI